MRQGRLPSRSLEQNLIVFTRTDRDRVQDRVLEMAVADPRVMAGAVVGSLAGGEGDRWSDLDLTFAVADDVPVPEVLEAWSGALAGEFGAIQLFDLPSGTFIYRVFLFPNCLELDLSFASAATFGPRGPSFRLLFGEAVGRLDRSPEAAEEAFGYAVHHTLHARACIERAKVRQAEYWISAIRDRGLALACRRRGLDGSYGRDFDKLPAEVVAPFDGALVRSFERDELDRALRVAVSALLGESVEAGQLVDRVEAQLRELSRIT
jgi:hypothetical protein